MPDEYDSFINDFRSAWSSGDRPRIAEFLGRVNEDDRDALLMR
ncbi:unnamed protein product, partial [marine sediment metagenome]